MSVSYHFFAITADGSVIKHLDGIIEDSCPIRTESDYRSVKATIGMQYGIDPGEIIICNLSALPEPGKKRGLFRR